MNMEMFRFEGFCPECMLKGEKIAMKLNRMDFYECEKSHLQMTVFPPYAAILRWRGEGNFRENQEKATEQSINAIITRADWRNGKETLPDTEEVFEDIWDIEVYIQSIRANEREYQEHKVDLEDAIFQQQKQNLDSITKNDTEELTSLYHDAFDQQTSLEAFYKFFQKVNDLGLIFSFNWPGWFEGHQHLKKIDIDYHSLSRLQVSMYLTTIFRSDRFDEGTVEHFHRNGVLQKLLSRLNYLTQ